MIEVSHLTKKYENTVAVSDLSFRIEKGHIYGFLGPNGAGKSTTMNIITGCLAATSGDVKIGGYDIFEQPKEAKKLIGYLPELPPLYTEQTVYEYLYFVAKAKGLRKNAVFDEIDRVIAETNIENVQDKLIKHLSKGYRQRVGVAQALIGNPEVIILDEPTVGLDPMQILEIRDLIKQLGESHTVIISSHILSEIQAVCDQVLIIHNGKLVAFDKPENLSRVLSSGNRVQLSAECTAFELHDLLQELEGIREVSISDETDGVCTAVVTVGDSDPKAVCREISLAFGKAGRVVLQLNPVKVQLEDIFLEITRDDIDLTKQQDAADGSGCADVQNDASGKEEEQ